MGKDLSYVLPCKINEFKEFIKEVEENTKNAYMWLWKKKMEGFNSKILIPNLKKQISILIQGQVYIDLYVNKYPFLDLFRKHEKIYLNNLFLPKDFYSMLLKIKNNSNFLRIYISKDGQKSLIRENIKSDLLKRIRHFPFYRLIFTGKNFEEIKNSLKENELKGFIVDLEELTKGLN